VKKGDEGVVRLDGHALDGKTVLFVGRWHSTYRGWLIVVDDGEHLTTLPDGAVKEPAGAPA
jgi:hypothetical protein